jgi:patatin-related protein
VPLDPSLLGASLGRGVITPLEVTMNSGHEAPRCDLPGIPREERDELRIALVLTGGVSLAVWMGGMCAELYELHAGRGIYGELLELTATDARIDVIAGTSAGGLNGALLGLAIARECAPEAMRDTRNLWLDHGTFENLLRSPFETDPPSLLDGDGYFLPKLKAALRGLAARGVAGPGRSPVHLILTTALLRGEPRGVPDDFGSVITDTDYRGQFVFRQDEEHRHFELPDIVDRLALAARSTASFPGAFEASFCPVDEGRPGRPGRPDMKGFVNFSTSRFLIDGGVLMNKPIRPALEAIFAQPARRPVRRVLAYAIPDPGQPGDVEAARAEETPTAGRVLGDSLLVLPREQSIGDDLEEIRAHNRKAEAQLRAVEHMLLLVAAAGKNSDGEPAYVGMAHQLFAVYRKSWAEKSAEDTLDRAASALRSLDVLRRLSPDRGHLDRDARWDLAGLREALQTPRINWLPPSFPDRGRFIEESEKGEWHWGITVLEHTATFLLDLYRQSLLLIRLPIEEGRREHQQTLWQCREELHSVLKDLRSVRTIDRDYWRVRLAALTGLESAELLGDWAQEAYAQWPGGEYRQREIFRDLARCGERIAGTFLRAAPLLRLQRSGLRNHGEQVPLSTVAGMGRLASLAYRLVPTGEGDDRRTTWEILRRLLALHVVQTALRTESYALGGPIELIQISADTPTEFHTAQTSGEKLAGLQLGHFGAFYKRSWRANDWTWGRLDGAARAVQFVLNPVQLQRIFRESSTALACLERIALPDAGADPELRRWWESHRAALREELGFLDAPRSRAPKVLPLCCRAITWRLHRAILEEELPALGEAVDVDQHEGARITSPAWAFRTASVRPTGASPAPELFRRCVIGQEKLADEIGSDKFSAVSGTLAAVALSVVQGERSGLGLLRPVLGAFRGVVLAFYFLTQGAVRQKKLGFALTAVLLTAGSILLAVGLQSGRPPWWTGAGLLLAPLVYLSLRFGSPRSLFELGGALACGLLPWYLPDLLNAVFGPAASGEPLSLRAIRWVAATLHAPDYRVYGAVICLLAGMAVPGALKRGFRRVKSWRSPPGSSAA